MQKEASRAGYIGVWALAGIISGLASGGLSFLMVSEFIRSNGSGSITALVVLPAIAGALAWCLTYMFFPSINTRKVIPYHVIAGIVALVISLFQAYEYRSSGEIPAVPAVIIVVWIATLIFLLTRAETFEAKINRYKPALNAHSHPDDRPAQSSEASGEGTSSSAETRPYPYAIARKVIEYSNDAELSWEMIQGLPENYKDQFLEALNNDPKTDTAALAERLTTECGNELRPFENSELNDLLDKCRKISDEAASEFMEVYELLGDTIKPEELFEKIETKFLSPKWVAPNKTYEWRAQKKAERESDREARAKAYHQNEAEKRVRGKQQ
jgi:hypothetical protein